MPQIQPRNPPQRANPLPPASLGDMVTAQDWPCGGGWSRTVSGIPAGYQENWDGKIDLAPVAVDLKGWDGVKQLYR